MKSFSGFTLIEVLVVAAITGFISTFLVINFQRTRIDLNEIASIFIEQIRVAQTRANSSLRYNDGQGAGLAIRCGYGIHYETTTSYSIYVGPNAATTTCSTQNRNLDADDFKLLPITKLSSTKVEFKSSFNDIFFEPPNPTTFINNSSASTAITITIGKVGGICPQDCKNINVSTSGKIE